MRALIASLLLVLSSVSYAWPQTRIEMERAIEEKMYQLLGSNGHNEVFWQGTGVRKNRLGDTVSVKCFATFTTGSFAYGTDKDLQLSTEKYYLGSPVDEANPKYLGDDVVVPQYSTIIEEYIKPYAFSVESKSHSISVKRAFRSGVSAEFFGVKISKDTSGKLAISVSTKDRLLGLIPTPRFEREKRLREFNCQNMRTISKDSYIKGLSGVASGR